MVVFALGEWGVVAANMASLPGAFIFERPKTEAKSLFATIQPGV